MSLEDVLMDAAEEVYDQEVSKSRSKKILQKSFSDDYENDSFHDDENNNQNRSSTNNDEVLNALRKSAQTVEHEEAEETRLALRNISQEMKDYNQDDKSKKENNRIEIRKDLDDNDVRKILTKSDECFHEEIDKHHHNEIKEESESEIEENDDDDNDDQLEHHNYPQGREFMFACYHGNLDEIERHAEKGASLRYKDRHGWTVLHWIASKGLKNALQVIIREFDNNQVSKCINIKDSITGWTPLHVSKVILLFSSIISYFSML